MARKASKAFLVVRVYAVFDAVAIVAAGGVSQGLLAVETGRMVNGGCRGSCGPVHSHALEQGLQAQNSRNPASAKQSPERHKGRPWPPPEDRYASTPASSSSSTVGTKSDCRSSQARPGAGSSPRARSMARVSRYSRAPDVSVHWVWMPSLRRRRPGSRRAVGGRGNREGSGTLPLRVEGTRHPRTRYPPGS